MKLRKATRVINQGILNMLILLPEVWCSGVFEFRLISFKNEQGLIRDETCCNGVRTSSGRGSVCSSSCRTFFTVCLTHYQLINSVKQPCTFGFVQTEVLGGNNVDFENSNSFTNPIRFQFENITLPGTFSLIIEAWNDASGTREQKEQISRLVVHRHLPKGPAWSNYTHDTGLTQLEYKYRVMCNPDYFGPDCSILCKPRDDHFGHYSCNSAGQKVCLSGWKGQNCNEGSNPEQISPLVVQRHLQNVNHVATISEITVVIQLGRGCVSEGDKASFVTKGSTCALLKKQPAKKDEGYRSP